MRGCRGFRYLGRIGGLGMLVRRFVRVVMGGVDRDVLVSGISGPGELRYDVLSRAYESNREL